MPRSIILVESAPYQLLPSISRSVLERVVQSQHHSSHGPAGGTIDRQQQWEGASAAKLAGPFPSSPASTQSVVLGHLYKSHDECYVSIDATLCCTLHNVSAARFCPRSLYQVHTARRTSKQTSDLTQTVMATRQHTS